MRRNVRYGFQGVHFYRHDQGSGSLIQFIDIFDEPVERTWNGMTASEFDIGDRDPVDVIKEILDQAS